MQCICQHHPFTDYSANFTTRNSPNQMGFLVAMKQTDIGSELIANYTKDEVVCEDDGYGSAGNRLQFPLPSHLKTVTSTSNPFVKHCLKLRQSSSYRHAHGSVLVVGSTPIREIQMFQKPLHGSLATLSCLLLPDKAEIPKGIDESSAHIVHVSSAVMKKLSGVKSSDAIDAIALIKIPDSFIHVHSNGTETYCRKWFSSPYRILVLDGIQDPGNLGTLFRTAVAFGWGGVFLLPGCCDPYNDKALRASRGASFQLPIVSGNWIHLQALIDEFQMTLLAGHPQHNLQKKPVSLLSQSFCDCLSETPLCLVLGSEGSGLSDKSQEECEFVSISMAGNFESLNVSVAGGIFLYMLQSTKNKLF